MELLEIIKKRFSPTEFTDKSISEQDLLKLFEAAGKAPSAYNEQPWRFIYARKEDKEAFKKILSCLAEFNQKWAKNAAVIIITVAKNNYSYNNSPYAHSWHDLGLSVGNLIAQATSENIYVHQMAGILPEKAIETLNIPEGYKPVTAIALGYFGGEPVFKERKKVDQIAFKGTWKD